MAKRFIVKIDAKGHIEVATDGIKGKECVDYISFLENLLEAKAIDSSFTKEYYETENVSLNIDTMAKNKLS